MAIKSDLKLLVIKFGKHVEINFALNLFNTHLLKQGLTLIVAQEFYIQLIYFVEYNSKLHMAIILYILSCGFLEIKITDIFFHKVLRLFIFIVTTFFKYGIRYHIHLHVNL